MTSTYSAWVVAFLVLAKPPSPFASNDFERGVKALNRGDYDRAITAFTAHLRKKPKDALAYLKRGTAYALKKNTVGAIADFTAAIRLDPKDDAAYNNRGNAYLEQKEYARAIADYTVAIRLDPKHADAYCNRGFAHAEGREYDKALADYARALRLNPKHLKAHINRGFAYTEKKEYDKAIEDFSAAIRLDARATRAHFGRGLAHAEKKEYGKALADYTTVIGLDPKHADALNDLAWLLATCPEDGVRDGKKALAHATQACRLADWKLAAYLDSLAAAHAECGQFKEAVKRQKQAIKRGYEDKDDELRARKRLRLYEANKPYRDE